MYIPNLLVGQPRIDFVKQSMFEHIATNPNSLKFQMFDLGCLLLRGDHQGHRRNAWRQEVHREISQHNPDINSFGKGKSEVLVSEIAEFIELEFRDYDYWLLDLGIAALEPDQHVTYKRRFNNIMHDVQTRLSNTFRDSQLELLWKNSCGAPEEGARYIFSSCVE